MIATKYYLQVWEYDTTKVFCPAYITNVVVIADTLEEAKKKALERTPKKHRGSCWTQCVEVRGSEDILTECSMVHQQAKEILVMKTHRCTWCNKEIEGAALEHNTDPFCSQHCLDLQLEDDALFAESEEILGDDQS